MKILVKSHFFGGDVDILSVDLQKIDLHDVNFYEDDPETILHVTFLPWPNKFEKRKTFKRDVSKELMPVAWHPAKWWDWSLPEDEKK